MKTIRHGAKSRDKVLHVEAEGCIVNIQVGLRDEHGREVTHISVQADQYAGEEWIIGGTSGTSAGIRVIKKALPEGWKPEEARAQMLESNWGFYAEGTDTGRPRYYRFRTDEERTRWMLAGERGRRKPVTDYWTVATIGDEAGAWLNDSDRDPVIYGMTRQIWTPEAPKCEYCHAPDPTVDLTEERDGDIVPIRICHKCFVEAVGPGVSPP